MVGEGDRATRAANRSVSSGASKILLDMPKMPLSLGSVSDWLSTEQLPVLFLGCEKLALLFEKSCVALRRGGIVRMPAYAFTGKDDEVESSALAVAVSWVVAVNRLMGLVGFLYQASVDDDAVNSCGSLKTPILNAVTRLGEALADIKSIEGDCDFKLESQKLGDEFVSLVEDVLQWRADLDGALPTLKRTFFFENCSACSPDGSSYPGARAQI